MQEHLRLMANVLETTVQVPETWRNLAGLEGIVLGVTCQRWDESGLWREGFEDKA